MPRKKTESQPLGELLGVRMPKAEQVATLKTLEGLPSAFYALLCQTEDQQLAFNQISLGYQYIKADIQALFAGEDEMIHMLPPDQRNFWGLMSDRYIAWYMVVKRGWPYLKAEWVADERFEGFQAATPGEALIKILELECQGFLEPAFSGRYRFAPSQHRTWAKSERDIARGTATLAQKRKIQTEITVSGLHLKSFVFSGLCIETCQKNANRDERLHNALSYYKSVMASLDRSIQKDLHPRQGRKGFEWRNGTQYKLGKGGTTNERYSA